MTQASDEPFCAIPSPDGAAELLIEQGDRSAHAYLVPLSMPDSTMRHCWIRNLTAAPDAWDVETMEAGNAPSLPREFCRDAGAAEPLDADRLRALWLPAGDGVALYEGEDLLIYIPPWSGHDGFPGYARDCASPSQIAWPMPEDPAPITEQLSHAEEFWEAWVAEPNLWDRLQPKFIEAAESALGTDSRYFAIDNGKWPPKAVLLFQQPDCMVAVTVGVSLRPQPRIVMEAENATAVHRIELALALPLTSAEEVIVRCGKSLSGLASLPWGKLHLSCPRALCLGRLLSSPRRRVGADRGGPDGRAGFDAPDRVSRRDGRCSQCSVAHSDHRSGTSAGH